MIGEPLEEINPWSPIPRTPQYGKPDIPILRYIECWVLKYTYGVDCT